MSFEVFSGRDRAWVTLREQMGTAPFPEDGYFDLMASGRFDARYSYGAGEVEEVGPGWLTLEEALEWARARAVRVDVHCFLDRGSVCFSAGEVDVSTPGRDGDDPRRIEPWPDDGLRLELRRYPGFEFLDRTEGQGPIAWSVKILGNAYDRPEGAAFAKAWAAALDAQPGVEVLDSRVWPIPPRHPSEQAPDPSGQAITYLMEPEGAGAQLQLSAATHAAAQALAADAGAAAITEARAQIGVVTEPWHWQEPTAFPSNLELASHTSLDANGIIF